MEGTLVLALCLGCVACKRKQSSQSRSESREPACKAACAAYVTAGCKRPELSGDDQARCVADCVLALSRSEAEGCGARFVDYLGCLSTAEIDCEAALGSASVSVLHGLGAEACAEKFRAHAACGGVCELAGMTLLGQSEVSGHTVQAEVIAAGCSDCENDVSVRAPARSRCEAASVCSQVCCRCPNTKAYYLARACSDGACAGRMEACELARAAVASDVCAPTR